MNAERPFPSELWEHTPAAVQEYIRALEARVTALEAAVQRLEATVQHLTERLQQDSRTSSRPPSSDPPQAIEKRPRREPSGRRPGGQPGHEGQARALVPVEEVDVVIPVKPMRCHRCQHPLRGRRSPAPAASGDGDPTGEAGGDGVSVAPLGLPGVWRSDPSGAARWESPPGDSAPGCRRSPRCARGRIICRNAPPRASWRICLASR